MSANAPDRNKKSETYGEPHQNGETAPRSSLIYWFVVGLAGLTTVNLLLWFGGPWVSRLTSAPNGSDGESLAGLEVGQPAPPLIAEGWVNGQPPANLTGKVVVVENWAYWCGPCRRKAPYLVALHRRFEKQGVVFVGLTPDEGDDLSKIRAFIDTYGITWPNGYGAADTLDSFRAEVLPLAWVIGVDGKVVWNQDSGTSLESGIKQALDQAKT
ncbi:MAG: TlpA family protein disulfide reductase [Planctomycetaceae bacterium]